MDFNLRSEVLEDGIVKLRFVDEQEGLVAVNESICKEYCKHVGLNRLLLYLHRGRPIPHTGIELDVGPAEIEQPGDFVKHVDDEGTVVVLLQLRAHGGKFVSVQLTGVFS